MPGVVAPVHDVLQLYVLGVLTFSVVTELDARILLPRPEPTAARVQAVVNLKLQITFLHQDDALRMGEQLRVALIDVLIQWLSQ